MLRSRVSASVPQFRAAGVSCGIKPSRALDLALVVSDRPARAGAVFTTSAFPGAPVQVSRRHLRGGRARAVVVNSGISNAATGARGLRDANRMCALAGELVGVPARQVQVASTGVIGEFLPMAKIERGIRRAARALAPDGLAKAARAILTTDSQAKLAHRSSRAFTLAGFAKGSGMVQPNMATMLAYLFTDAALEPRYMNRLLREAVEPTFNRLSIDGEMSTSDTVLLIANGASGRPELQPGARGARAFERALGEVCEELVTALATDGEGVTRLADVIVTGARSHGAALQVARSVARSALFKTALFGGDPNYGRIVQAVGAAGVPLRPERIAIRVAGVPLLRRGQPVPGFAAARRRAAKVMQAPRVAVEIALGQGQGRARMLTTDLTYEYVRINAEYTT